MGEVFLAGENDTINKDARIGRDGFTSAINVRIEGEISRRKGNKKMDKFTEY